MEGRRGGWGTARNCKAHVSRGASHRCYRYIRCCSELRRVGAELGLSPRWGDAGRRRRRFSAEIEGLGVGGRELRGLSWGDIVGHKEGRLGPKNIIQ